MHHYNIVWTIVDSVRRYHTDEDDRGRLNIMDEFAREAVEFKNVVTSAPSTVMSISAMMTSLPSYYLGRNYSDFRFDNDYFTTFSSLLNSNGYTTRALIMHREIREKLRVFDLIPSKYWPPGYSHKDWWDNAKINRLLHNAIHMDGENLPKPAFWFLDFNCRNDSNTSDLVKDSMQALQEAGYTKDNTIFILCSDHGYPDPSRGITPEGLKRKNMTHDIFMTDDNITIPLMISYPGCERGKQVVETISTLDIMPTLLDILEIDVDPKVSARWKGKSILPYLNGEEDRPHERPMIRTDARFMGQSGRVTAIRGDKYKYVYHHDTKTEEFFDISEFRIDEKNIIETDSADVKNNLVDFRKAFEASEQAGIEFQIDYVAHRIEKQLDKLHKNRDKSDLKILVVSTSGGNFLPALGRAMRRVASGGTIELVTLENISDLADGLYNKVMHFSSKEKCELDTTDSQYISAKAYDLVIVTYDSGFSTEYEKLRAFSRSVKHKKQVMMDLNMTMSVRKGQFHRYLKTLHANKYFYMQEPSLVIVELKRLIRTMYVRTKLKLLKAA